MEKKLEDYLYFYLGCEYLLEEYESGRKCKYTIDGMVVSESVNLKYGGDWYFSGDNNFSIKPILRPLSDMTEEEEIERDQIWNRFSDEYMCIIADAMQTAFLLKQGFDLFGLIESGLAIDKTTLTPSSIGDKDKDK